MLNICTDNKSNNTLLYILLCFCFAFPRLVYPMLSVSLDCPFLIAPSVFSNVYLPLCKILLVQENIESYLPNMNALSNITTHLKRIYFILKSLSHTSSLPYL